MTNFSGFRPRMRQPPVRARAESQHSRYPQFRASFVSGDTRGRKFRLAVGILLNFGSNHMGDKISIGGDVTGGAVGSHAKVRARDITSYKQVVGGLGLEGDLTRKLVEARELLETLGLAEDDKNDAADDLGKLAEELQKPVQEPGRVQRLWNQIK